MRFFILDENRRIIEVSNSEQVHRWMEGKDDLRQVAYDDLGRFQISTVFTGTDYRFGLTGAPLIYETLIRDAEGGELDRSVDRTSTWQEAEQAHERAVELAKKASI